MCYNCDPKLINKLNKYGVCGKTNKWISSFLNSRTQKVLVEGESSALAQVVSGVPQGSVLGPSLFLFYINDMPENISSTVRLFADDTIVYLTLNPPTNSSILQEDLNKLSSWEKQWSMEFHPDKCQVLPITRNKIKLQNKYTLNGHTLAITDNAKYLGLTITSNLSWNQHIGNITNKANKTLGFIRRNIKISSPQIKAQAYKTLVRPIVEYSSSVWNPYTETNIYKLEMVQRRAARFVLNSYHNTASVSNMINHLNWKTLQTRRKEASLVMFYKIVYGLVFIPAQPYLTPITKESRLHHNLSFIIPYSKQDYHLYSFFPNTIRAWNALPQHIVNTTELETFKTQIQNMKPTN